MWNALPFLSVNAFPRCWTAGFSSQWLSWAHSYNYRIGSVRQDVVSGWHRLTSKWIVSTSGLLHTLLISLFLNSSPCWRSFQTIKKKKVSLSKSIPDRKINTWKEQLGCCNLEGVTATSSPGSLRSCLFNGNNMSLFKWAVISSAVEGLICVLINLLHFIIWLSGCCFFCVCVCIAQIVKCPAWIWLYKFVFRCEWVSFHDVGWNRNHPFASGWVGNAIRGPNTWASFQGISRQELRCPSFLWGWTKKRKTSK